MLGSVLAVAPHLRDRMVLATKGGIMPPVPVRLVARLPASACEASLRRLGVDVIDLYQIHRPDMFTHPADVAATLAALRDEGKIREVGVSNHTPAQVAALAAPPAVPDRLRTSPSTRLVHLDPAPRRHASTPACGTGHSGRSHGAHWPVAGSPPARTCVRSCSPCSTDSPTARASIGRPLRSRSSSPTRRRRWPSSARSSPSASRPHRGPRRRARSRRRLRDHSGFRRSAPALTPGFFGVLLPFGGSEERQKPGVAG